MILTQLESRVVEEAKGTAIILATELGNLDECLLAIEDGKKYGEHFVLFMDFFLRCHFNQALGEREFKPLSGEGHATVLCQSVIAMINKRAE